MAITRVIMMAIMMTQLHSRMAITMLIMMAIMMTQLHSRMAITMVIMTAIMMTQLHSRMAITMVIMMALGMALGQQPAEYRLSIAWASTSPAGSHPTSLNATCHPMRPLQPSNFTPKMAMRHSDGTRSRHWHALAPQRAPKQSEAIRSNPKQPEAIRSNQKQSRLRLNELRLLPRAL